jgi:hypothetical protein
MSDARTEILGRIRDGNAVARATAGRHEDVDRSYIRAGTLGCCCSAGGILSLSVMSAPAITLTDDQLRALPEAGAGPHLVLDPRTNQDFVLIRLAEYERLTANVYDDSPWTRDELAAVAWESAERSEWDDDDFGPTPDTSAEQR